MKRWHAHRLGDLPPYLFVEIDRKKRQAVANGEDVIDFGVGDPDKPTPGFIMEQMALALRKPVHHRYPPDIGTAEFRGAAARFLHRRFGVNVEPDRQVLAVIGTKEGIGHLPLGVVNPGETVLVPQPGYPVYSSATLFAGANVHVMPLTEGRSWLPDLDAIPRSMLASAKLLFLNYPNNPTGAFAPLSFFEQAVAFAREHDILIAQDAAYSEVWFDQPPPSILQVDGAMDVAVEFHSASKTFNMTGWRAGFAAGNADALAALAKIKNNVDSGQFGAVQEAAAHALDHADHVEVRAMQDVYRRRRDIVLQGLQEMGLRTSPSPATFYVWAACPDGYTSMEYAAKLLTDAAVVVVPGVGFGPEGEGYFRMALTVSASRTREALDRMRRVHL